MNTVSTNIGTNEAECLAADTGEVRDPGRTELLAAYNSTSATPIGIKDADVKVKAFRSPTLPII